MEVEISVDNEKGPLRAADASTRLNSCEKEEAKAGPIQCPKPRTVAPMQRYEPVIPLSFLYLVYQEGNDETCLDDTKMGIQTDLSNSFLWEQRIKNSEMSISPAHRR